ESVRASYIILLLLIAGSLALALRQIGGFSREPYIWFVSRIQTGCPEFLERPSRPRGVTMKIATRFGLGCMCAGVFLAAQTFGQSTYTTPEAQKATAQLSQPAGPLQPIQNNTT